jgi:ribonuclease HI
MSAFTDSFQSGIPMPANFQDLTIEEVDKVTKTDTKDKKGKKNKEEEKPPGLHGIVLYTDGSTRPNPGFGGYGLHGYMYEVTEPKKGSGNQTDVLTRYGYVPKKEAAQKAKVDPDTGETAAGAAIKEVKPTQYFDGYGCFHVPVTNNYCELQGLNHSLKLANNYDIRYLTVLTDSMYVVEGINRLLPVWKNYNWTKKDGRMVQHKHTWLDAEQGKQALEAKGVRISVRWVKGHSVHLGNQLADKNSRMGSHRARDGVEENVFISEGPEGYWNTKYEKHPFLFHRAFYFTTREHSNQPGEYYLGEHGKDHEMIGTSTTDTRHSAVILKTPEPLIEILRDHQVKVSNGKEALVLGRLDKLFNNNLAKDINRFGTVCLLRRDSKRLDLYGIEQEKPKEAVYEGSDEQDEPVVSKTIATDDNNLPGIPITRELNPPLLAYRALQAVNLLKGLLLTWRKEDLEPNPKSMLGVTDITDTLFDKDDKDNFSLKKDYASGFTTFKQKVAYKDENNITKHHEIVVDMASDMPDRNVFKRIEKAKPRVFIITWTESETSFRYATIIDMQGDLGIWAASYSNLRFTVTPKAINVAKLTNKKKT